MARGEPFKTRRVWNETAHAYDHVVVAACSKCPRETVIASASVKDRSVGFFADKFRQKGWRIAPRRTGDECPHCVGGLTSKPRAPISSARVALSPAQRRAAFCRIAGVPRAAASPKPETPKGAVMSKPVKSPALTVVADAPRQPTRDDIRAILDALGDCYLTEKGCYAGDGSDEALSKRLNVPRAWVAVERERVFGPDACEDDGADRKLIPVLIARADDIESRALALGVEAETLRTEIRRLEGRLAKRGVA